MSNDQAPAPAATANELRGEADLELEGQRFVLRPSYEAVLEAEKLTGKGLIQLATEAADGELTAGHAAIIVTLFIRAWGKAQGCQQTQAVQVPRIGELLHEYGLMRVNLRLAYVLGNAATGGCKADGTPKRDDASGEVEPMVGTTATPAVG